MTAEEEVNWDGEAAQAAWQVVGYDRSYSEGERRAGFNTGARWQRKQLRTPEAVERVALWLVGMLTPFSEWPSNEDLEGEPTGDRDVEFKAAWMDEARAVIAALLGED